jgi:hypothetical protein
MVAITKSGAKNHSSWQDICDPTQQTLSLGNILVDFYSDT